MAIFTNRQKNTAITVYEKMKPYIAEKDGKVHVIMINSFSKMLNQGFVCDDKYTTEIDTLLSAMQDDGYEIVDVKLNTIVNHGVMGQMEGYITLVTYR